MVDPPGPVDNKRIGMMKNGQLMVRTNSDHGQLSGEMWQYLYQIYGGGPELIIKQVNPQPAPARTLAEQAAASSANKGHEKVNSDSVGKGHEKVISDSANARTNSDSPVTANSRLPTDTETPRSGGVAACKGNEKTPRNEPMAE